MTHTRATARTMSLVALLFFSPLHGGNTQSVGKKPTKPSSVLVTKHYCVDDFTVVKIASILVATITQGPRRVSVTADTSALHHVSVTRNDKTLSIDVAQESWPYISNSIPTIAISLPVLTQLHGSGSAEVTAEDITSHGDLTVVGEKTARISLKNISVATLMINSSGHATMSATGKADVQKCSVLGASSYDGSHLVAQHSTITSNGTSHTHTHSKQSSTITLHGSSTMEFTGVKPFVVRALDTHLIKQ